MQKGYKTEAILLRMVLKIRLCNMSGGEVNEKCKKIIGIFVVLFGLFLGGCENQGEAKAEMESQEINGTNTLTGESTTEEPSWKEQHLSLEKQYQLASVTADKIYGFCEENGEPLIVCQDKASGEIVQQVTLPGIVSVQSMDVDEEGNVYIVGIAEDGQSEFWKIDTEGNCSPVGEIVLEGTENAQFIEPKGFYVDHQGYFYAWYEMGVPVAEVLEDVTEEDADVYGMVDRIYVKDAQFNTIFYSQVPNFNGSRLLSFSVEDGTNPTIVAEDAEGIYLQEMDIEQEKLSEVIRLEDDLELTMETAIVTTLENGFLFCQGSELYEYDYTTKEKSKLLNFASVGVYASDILYLKFYDQQIEMIDSYGEEKNTEYTLLEKGESEKTILTLGVMSMENASVLEKIVTEYNRSHEEIRIDVTSYYNEQIGFDAGVEQLKLDVIRGEAPDIIDVSSLDYRVFADKGVFADLYEFMQNDSECGSDKMISSVLNAYERNGSLYSISPSFQLYSMWGNDEVLQGRQGITLAELMQILENNGKSINAIFGFSADEPVLTTLCTFGMDEFVDWDNGTCEFTGEYFKELLIFAKEYDPDFSEGGLSQNIRNGNIVLSVGLITSVADYQIQSELYGGKLSFVGYPTAGGSGTAVSFRGNELAINAKAENQEVAWEFVKYYLLNGYTGEGFPVVTAQFDKVMAESMEPTMITSVEGTYEVAKGTYQGKGTYIEVFTATQADVEAVKKLVEEADNRYEYNTEILNIITEEAEGYFVGQKDLEQTTEIIQNRVQLYLQEQM